MKTRYALTVVIDHGAEEDPYRMDGELRFVLTGLPLDGRRAQTGPRIAEVTNVDWLGVTQ